MHETTVGIMDAIAEENVKHYLTDYTNHDKPWIEKNEGKAFIWIVRDSGTHLVSECTKETTHQVFEGQDMNYIESARVVLDYYKDQAKFFYCDKNEGFRRVGHDQAVDLFNTELIS
jgi:hypothetical protein